MRGFINFVEGTVKFIFRLFIALILLVINIWIIGISLETYRKEPQNAAGIFIVAGVLIFLFGILPAWKALKKYADWREAVDVRKRYD